MEAVYSNDLKKAERLMDDSKWEKPNRNRLLFYLNKGTVLWMNGKNEQSNIYFKQADYFIEDYQKNYAEVLFSLITNQGYTTYQGENFEQILLQYYVTLNFIQLGDFDNALVACKRMQLTMQKITDSYKENNKYKRDAFAHNLLGMIYDAQHEYNSAFVAYRNALEIYNQDYKSMLETEVPMQLKKDLLRTAYLTGFDEELGFYEKEFRMKHKIQPDSCGSVVFFWNNGLCPIKDRNEINFTIMPQGDGWVEFVNVNLGMRYRFYIGNENDRKNLSELKIVRIAWPKYISRSPIFDNAIIVDSSGNQSKLELAEDINAIAYKSLEDRMFKEIATTVLRMALKQALESASRKNDKNAGAAISIINAFTEQADTRNWQLLPYSINYTRVFLPEGNNKLTLQVTSSKSKSTEKMDYFFDIKRGQTLFGSSQTLQFSGYTDKYKIPVLMH